jgi:hypothetical protein
MSAEDRIMTLKDGLLPDLEKLVIFIKFDTVGELMAAAMEVEALDKKRALQRSLSPSTKLVWEMRRERPNNLRDIRTGTKEGWVVH